MILTYQSNERESKVHGILTQQFNERESQSYARYSRNNPMTENPKSERDTNVTIH